jgi:UDP-hydrolysing UDP-N-acetyl-D-glucosamine 2-epimerase
MKKIVYFLSNRCSYYRSSTLLKELNKTYELTLILSGALLKDEFQDTYIEIKKEFRSIDIACLSDGSLETMAKSSVGIGEQAVKHLLELKPDCLILWADRYELLPVAQAAAYLNIPIAHIQGGETSGNIDDKVRNAVSMLSTKHFVSHLWAGDKLEKMGLTDIHNTGCPSLDVIKRHEIKRTSVEGYIISIFHPHTKELSSLKEQTLMYVKSVQEFAKEQKLTIMFFASNDDPGYQNVNITDHLTLKMDAYNNIRFVNNMQGVDFLKLLAKARFIVGNSSAGIREASYLGVPAVNVGKRQENRISSSNCVDVEFDRIKAGLKWAYEAKPGMNKMFGDGEAVEKIMEELKGWFNGVAAR